MTEYNKEQLRKLIVKSKREIDSANSDEQLKEIASNLISNLQNFITNVL